MSTTVIHTDDLMALNREAVRRHFNRTLSTRMIDALDPDGVNVITFTLGQDDIIRVLLMLKLVDRDEPVDAWLDMTYDRYSALPRLERSETGEWRRAETST